MEECQERVLHWNFGLHGEKQREDMTFTPIDINAVFIPLVYILYSAPLGPTELPVPLRHPNHYSELSPCRK